MQWQCQCQKSMAIFFRANGLGFLVIHIPAAFPKLFASLSAVEGQKGFSLTSGLEKQRLALKLFFKVNSALNRFPFLPLKSVSLPKFLSNEQRKSQ